MESLFLLAFDAEEFLAALAMAGAEAFFNKLLTRLPDIEALALAQSSLHEWKHTVCCAAGVSAMRVRLHFGGP
jgi:hypothetical protein